MTIIFLYVNDIISFRRFMFLPIKNYIEPKNANEVDCVEILINILRKETNPSVLSIATGK